MQTPVSICITCTVDLLNLLVVRVEAVDDLAASSENVVLCLKQVLDSGFAEDDQGARVKGSNNPFTRPLLHPTHRQYSSCWCASSRRI